MVLIGPISQIVPSWIPGHLFWAYFVGFALLAAALSFAVGPASRLAAPLLGLMLLIFVASIHIPLVASKPSDRIIWAVALRDFSFALGAFALGPLPGRFGRFIPRVARVAFAVPLIFFAAEHFLHPHFAPGVPLGKLTPAWVPLAPLWAWITGAILLATAIALLLDRYAALAAAALGFWLLLLSAFLYLPDFLVAPPAGLIEGVNYVADTLLFSGLALFVAAGAYASRSGATVDD